MNLGIFRKSPNTNQIWFIVNTFATTDHAFCLISGAFLVLSFEIIIIAVIMTKANSNSSVIILIEFIDNPLPSVIGFGNLVIVQMIIRTTVPPIPT